MSRSKYIPKGFESDSRSNDTSANIYESMLESEAFMDLTKNQRLLYVYCKKQYYGKRKPQRDYPDIEEFKSEECFYFCLSMAERYGLYTRKNKGQFYKDMKALVSHGFIDVVSNGKYTKSKTVYRYSYAWKLWKHG